MVTGEGTFVCWAGWTDDGMSVDNSVGANWEGFGDSQGFYLFPILAPILQFSGNHSDSTIFWYSP